MHPGAEQKQGQRGRGPTPDDPRLEAWATFLRAHAVLTRQLERELQAERGLSLADYDVLVQLALAEGHRLRMSELAERLVLSRSGVTRLVDRLVAQAFVAREACDTDLRGWWAVLTDQGLERLRDASPVHLRGVGEHFLDRVPPADLEQLRRTLDRVAGSRPEGSRSGGERG